MEITFNLTSCQYFKKLIFIAYTSWRNPFLFSGLASCLFLTMMSCESLLIAEQRARIIITLPALITIHCYL